MCYGNIRVIMINEQENRDVGKITPALRTAITASLHILHYRLNGYENKSNICRICHLCWPVRNMIDQY
jgi:hypothetical protein